MAQSIPPRGSQGPRPVSKPGVKQQVQSTPTGKERAIPKLPPKTPRPSAQRPVQRQDEEESTPVEVDIPVKSTLGNKLGYIIAGAIVVGLISALVIILVFPGPSDTVNITPQMLELKVPKPVTAVINSEPTGSGNAADDYKDAIQLAKACHQEAMNSLENVYKNNNYGVIEDSVVKKLKAVNDKITAGASRASMQIVNPEDMAYTQKCQLAEDFIEMFTDQLILARYYYDKKDYPTCEKTLLSLFTMGWHMMNERAKMQMTLCGMTIQQQALTANDIICLNKLYNAWGKTAKVQEIQAYDTSLFSAKLEGEKKRQYLWCASPKPGDVFSMVQSDQDRTWSVESLIILGNLKFSTDSRGDRNYAMKLIDEYCNNKDPLKAAAAKSAKALTVEARNAAVVQ